MNTLQSIILSVVALSIAVFCIYFSKKLVDKKSCFKQMLLDLVFYISLWWSFDTGWCGIYSWPQINGDLFNWRYIVSAVFTIILFLIYINRRGIDIGRQKYIKNFAIPDFLKQHHEWKYFLIITFITVAFLLLVTLPTGLVKFNPDLRYVRMLPRLAGYVLFVGLLEELVFRGLLQTKLKKILNFKGGLILAIIISNILFAIMYTHIAEPEFPNLTYVILAFVAGLFYASVYHKTNNIWAAALLHGIVDFIKLTLFPGDL